ncbi:MAG: AMP-binding protein [Candidatus Methanofastidiosia archaeon]|jgi:phenylacetate-coenzyme A ligase PaaK-like adenylate-forming protein
MEDWDNVQGMSFKDIKKMQSKKLRSFLKMMNQYHPYYRELFKKKGINVSKIKSIDDLEKIPFTTKSDMMRTDETPKKPYSFALEYQKKEYSTSQTMFTGGATGEPIPIVYSIYDVDILRETGNRLADIFKLDQENDIIVNGFPYKPHLAFWQTFHTTMQLGTTALQSGGAKIMGTDKIITALEKLEATTFFTPPGYALYALGGAVVFNRDIQYLETVVMGMDVVYPDYKERIKEVLTIAGAETPRVMSEYILSEAKHAWGECADSTGYHTYPDLEIIEVINPETGEPVPEGEKGEIVFTSLDGGGTNVLRFKTGDLGKIVYEQCPHCERTVPRIQDVEKSTNYVDFKFPDGEKTVNFNALYQVLMGHRGIVQWQLEIKKKNGYDALHLLISVMKGMDENEIITDIKERIPTETGAELESITAMRLRDLLPRLGFETEYMEKRIKDLRNAQN